MSQQRSPVPVRPGDTNALVAWLQDVVRQVRLAWRLLFDERVSFWLKLIPPAALAYVVFPVDILPDVVPIAGQLDDVAVVLLGLKLFIELVPPQIRREHLEALGARVREWRVVDEEPKPEKVVEGQLEIESPEAGPEGELPAESKETPRLPE